jgi:alpha-1,2-mannosyltransferase
MTDRTVRALWVGATVLAVAWGVWSYVDQLTEAMPRILRAAHGRDFASYHLAVHTLAAGDDPYDVQALATTARSLDLRVRPHPFFYPPPFLPMMRWCLGVPLREAYRQWVVVDALCAGASLAVLGVAWRRLHPLVPIAAALCFGTTTAIVNNQVMGQANHLVLLLVVLGIWLDGRDRPRAAGVLVGTAAMLKMSPALFVAWWVLQRRWAAVGAAIGTAVGLSVLALLQVPLGLQVHFYLDVLPGFASGSYNGLSVPIHLFGNHSIPDLANAAFPGTGTVLSPTARTLSRLATLALLAGTAWRLRRPRPDPLAHAAQASCIAVLMLLVPVYTYEHHLVWALPAVIVLAAGLGTGRLHRGWIPVVLLAAWVLGYDLQVLKRWARVSAYGGLLEESKFLALFTLYALTAWLGGTRAPDQGPGGGAAISQPVHVAS